MFCDVIYRARLKGFGQVWRILFPPTAFIQTCRSPSVGIFSEFHLWMVPNKTVATRRVATVMGTRGTVLQRRNGERRRILIDSMFLSPSPISDWHWEKTSVGCLLTFRSFCAKFCSHGFDNTAEISSKRLKDCKQKLRL